VFLKNSRYFGIPTVEAIDRSGRSVAAVKLRKLPLIDGDPTLVEDRTQLDVTAERNYKDATRYWHIADANTELEASDLVATPGRTILVPRS
jgi:hypothetical protein